MAPPKGFRPHNKLAPETEVAVAAAYDVDRRSRVIAAQFGIAKGTVLRIAEERGIKRRANGLTDDQISTIRGLCGTGASGPDIAEAAGTTATTVYVYAARMGLRVAPEGGYDFEEECQHDYFDRIDTEHKAYWLGILVTDGCVSGQNEVILSLHVRDIALVRAFKAELQSSSKISICEDVKKSIDGGKPFLTTCARVAIRSKRLSAALARHQILPAKTRDPRMVEGVPRRFVRHFWRGAVDGDGWICLGNRGNGRMQPLVGLTGGMPIVRAFQAFCQAHTPTRANIHPNGSVHKFTVTDWFAHRMLKLMYSDSTIWLPRKYRRYLDVIAYFKGKERPNRRWKRKAPGTPLNSLFSIG